MHVLWFPPGDRRVLLMIIGVTGSRDWTDRKKISDAFDDAVAARPDDHGPMIVIEGGAPGADTLCRAEANSRGWHAATVKALWGYYGNGAGHIRNDVMIYLGKDADVWLAFINPCIKEDCPERGKPHDSHGTAGCAERAEAAGITVRRYRNG